jgi:Asp-tRNA(Asn)/Glu-tRNA(Gln) amidotransferase A subunit family amidase
MPTPARCPLRGGNMYVQQNTMSMEIVKAVSGPMTTNSEDMELLYKIYFSDYTYDNDRKLPRATFNEQLLSENNKLRVGVIKNIDEIVSSSPSVNRAQDTVVKILESKGHEVVSVEIPEIQQQTDNLLKIVMS